MLLRTLGELALQGSDFSRPKPLLMVAYLALEGRTSRRVLADLFWMDAGNPRDALSTTLRRLRRADPNLIIVDGDHLSAHVDCDAVELMRTPIGAWLDRPLHDVLAAHAGPFVDGLDLSLGIEMEEWVFQTRERLVQRACEVWIARADVEVQRGSPAEARMLAEAAWRTLDEHDAPTDLVRRIGARLAATGSPLVGAARLKVQAAGIDLPSGPELKSDSALPPAVDRFVGRREELDRAHGWLRAGSGRLLTVLGIGGIGKTRFALEIARREEALRSFSGGVVFVSMESVSQARDVAGPIGRRLGVDLEGAADPMGRVASWIGAREILLVLDNYEQLLPDVEPVLRLLKECPNTVLVVTSRERLHLRAEHVFPLDGLVGRTDRVPPSERPIPEAVELFVDRAERNMVSSLEGGTLELSELADLCESIGGSPLAIELAAAWVGVMTIHELREAFERDLGSIRRAHVDLDPRHASVSATLEVTWRRLSPDLRAKLGRLSVFRGGIDRGFAERIAGVTLDDLQALIDRALLRVSAPGRFDLHPLTRAFAAERISESGERWTEARDAHAEAFLAWTNDLRDQLGRSRQAEVRRRLEREIENIRTAWLWAVESRRIDWIETYVWAVSDAFDDRSFDGARLFEETSASLAMMPVEPTPTLSLVQIELARHLEALAEYRAASELLERATSRVPESGAIESLARARFTLGKMFIREGAYERARDVLYLPGWELPGEPKGPLSQTFGPDVSLLGPRNRASILAALAYLDMRSRPLPPRELVPRLEQMDEELRELGFADFILNILTGTGWYLVQNVGVEAAAPKFRAADRLREQVGPNWIEPYTVHGLATVALERGDLDRAAARYDEAMQLASHRGDAYLISHIESYLARLSIRRSDTARARAHVERALDLSEAHGIVPHMLFAVFVGAELLVAEGRTPDAISLVLEVNDHPLFEDPRSVEAFLRKVRPSEAVHIEDARNDVVGVPVDDHEVERWRSFGRQDRLEEQAMQLAMQLRSMLGG